MFRVKQSLATFLYKALPIFTWRFDAFSSQLEKKQWTDARQKAQPDENSSGAFKNNNLINKMIEARVERTYVGSKHHCGQIKFQKKHNTPDNLLTTLHWKGIYFLRYL